MRVELVPFVVKTPGFPLTRSRAITRSPDHPISAVLVFRCPRCRAIPGIPAIGALARHGPLPASLSQDPTPHKRFVENKSQTPIRKACQKPVDPSFSRFSGLQSGSFSALFSRFYCPVGRGSQRTESCGAQNRGPRPARFWLGGVDRRAQNHRLKKRCERSAYGGFGQLLIANC